MAWPASTVATTHLDQDSDSVLSARAQIKSVADAVNDIIQSGFHTGNDGTGSGLDADKVDGYDATATPTASRVVVSSATGKVDGWVSDATDTVKGKVGLATDAEVAAGSSTSLAITPAGLFSTLVKVHSNRGYQKLPNGLIIQWGSFYVNATVGTCTWVGSVTFPVAFPSACGGFSLSWTGANPRISLGANTVNASGLGNIDASDNGSGGNRTGYVYWIAVGY